MYFLSKKIEKKVGLNLSAGIASLKCPRWIISVLKGFLINCEVVSICRHSGSVQKQEKTHAPKSLLSLQQPGKKLPLTHAGSSHRLRSLW